ncbi:ABC transporter permease, partial [Clostridium botulinum]|nr:ABC transporter permease [Clostridium botulinum]
MSKYIRKRIVEAIPILIFISIISFLLIKLAPGDPIRAFINLKMKPSD